MLSHVQLEELHRVLCTSRLPFFDAQDRLVDRQDLLWNTLWDAGFRLEPHAFSDGVTTFERDDQGDIVVDLKRLGDGVLRTLYESAVEPTKKRRRMAQLLRPKKPKCPEWSTEA